MRAGVIRKIISEEPCAYSDVGQGRYFASSLEEGLVQRQSRINMGLLPTKDDECYMSCRHKARTMHAHKRQIKSRLPDPFARGYVTSFSCGCIFQHGLRNCPLYNTMSSTMLANSFSGCACHMVGDLHDKVCVYKTALSDNDFNTSYRCDKDITLQSFKVALKNIVLRFDCSNHARLGFSNVRPG